MSARISEQRNATRADGQFSHMSACELCGKGATLEPAFGGDSGVAGAEQDKAWGKLICAKCARAAAKRVDPWLAASALDVRKAWRRYVDDAPEGQPPRTRLAAMRKTLAELERDEELLPGSWLDIVREGHS